jgi:hypothetical protein
MKLLPFIMIVMLDLDIDTLPSKYLLYYSSSSTSNYIVDNRVEYFFAALFESFQELEAKSLLGSGKLKFKVTYAKPR